MSVQKRGSTAAELARIVKVMMGSYMYVETTDPRYLELVLESLRQATKCEVRRRTAHESHDAATRFWERERDVALSVAESLAKQADAKFTQDNKGRWKQYNEETAQLSRPKMYEKGSNGEDQ